jgi:exonuclease VII large subunit
MGADGRIVRSAAALKSGDVIKTRFSDGETTSRVES